MRGEEREERREEREEKREEEKERRKEGGGKRKETGGERGERDDPAFGFVAPIWFKRPLHGSHFPFSRSMNTQGLDTLIESSIPPSRFNQLCPQLVCACCTFESLSTTGSAPTIVQEPMPNSTFEISALGVASSNFAPPRSL